MVKLLGATHHVSWIHRLVQGNDIPGRVVCFPHTGPVTGLPSEVRVMGQHQSAGS